MSALKIINKGIPKGKILIFRSHRIQSYLQMLLPHFNEEIYSNHLPQGLKLWLIHKELKEKFLMNQTLVNNNKI